MKNYFFSIPILAIVLGVFLTSTPTISDDTDKESVPVPECSDNGDDFLDITSASNYDLEVEYTGSFPAGHDQVMISVLQRTSAKDPLDCATATGWTNLGTTTHVFAVNLTQTWNITSGLRSDFLSRTAGSDDDDYCTSYKISISSRDKDTMTYWDMQCNNTSYSVENFHYDF